MNLTEYAIAKGYKLSKPDSNLLTKLENDYKVRVGLDDPDPVYAVNPVNGASCAVNPLIWLLHRFVIRTYSTYGSSAGMNYNCKPVSIAIFDRVRYLILKLDKKAYAELID